MGHANSKLQKKKGSGLAKEKSRSRSFLKPKKRESDSNLNNSHGDNNERNKNNETDIATVTSTTLTATLSSSASLPPPSPPPTPVFIRHAKEGESNNLDDNKNNLDNDKINNSNINYNNKEHKDEENGINENRHIIKSHSLRESIVFDEGEKVQEIVDEEEDTHCPVCEEETLCMYSLEVCGHSVCISCLYGYSEQQLKNLSPDAHEILCPVPQCTCIISSSDLKAALDTFGAPSVVNNKPKILKVTVGKDGEVEGENEEKAEKKKEPEGEREGEKGEKEGEKGEKEGEKGGEDGVNMIHVEDGAEGSSNGKRINDVEEVGESSSSGSRNSNGNANESAQPSLAVQLTQSLEALLSKGNYVHCPNPNCKFVFERLPPASRRKSEVVLDEAGNPISPEASKHREEHRFRCRNCGTNFCAACKTVPYHLGFTCKQKMASMRAKHCRFCDTDMPPNSKPYSRTSTTPILSKKKDKSARKSFLLKFKGKSKTDFTEDLELDDNPRVFYLCKAKDCTTKVLKACSRFLDCNHACSGSYNDMYSDCFCLKEGCCSEDSQNSEEFCNICWTEPLSAAPCYRLGCGHVFHTDCITSKLQKEWPGPAISFTFLNCPLCSKIVSHRVLDSMVNRFRDLMEQVKTRALQRLEHEGMMNDPRVTEPDSEFYAKPAEYAVNIFSFYLCYACKNPYFGGRRACEVPQAPAGAEAPAFNPQELLCGGCSTLNAKCSKHGKEYIEYKCRFCCSLATFYCGGKAHFCTPCHDKAGQLVEFVNWTTTATCEPCKGPGLCTLGVAHKENGEEFSLGCSICRASG